ncbi:MAG: helix-turn-helix domain-containing protein [Oscillospiraceae bacterium]|nr:helix-turn-helix domain-containing protein [Oscillospiraceae bacterium]
MNTLSQAHKPYVVDNNRIGGIIRDARRIKGMTQEQLAEAVDITPAFIGHIERGGRSLSLTSLVGIANVLDIPMSYFFADEDITPDQKTMTAFAQLIEGRSDETKQAALEIIRTALNYLD